MLYLKNQPVTESCMSLTTQQYQRNKKLPFLCCCRCVSEDHHIFKGTHCASTKDLKVIRFP